MFVNDLLIVLLPLVATALAMPSSPASTLNKRSVTCLDIGVSATATWTNSAGQTCTYTGVVGSNYGTNAAGGEYVLPSHSPSLKTCQRNASPWTLTDACQ